MSCVKVILGNKEFKLTSNNDFTNEELLAQRPDLLIEYLNLSGVKTEGVIAFLNPEVKIELDGQDYEVSQNVNNVYLTSFDQRTFLRNQDKNIFIYNGIFYQPDDSAKFDNFTRKGLFLLTYDRVRREEEENKKKQLEEESKNQQSNLFKTKIDQFDYTYNPETKEVIHNSKTGDKVETNETQINKVLVEYAKSNNFEIKTYNKKQYVKIDNKILNVNNGNQIKDKRIVQLFDIKKTEEQSNQLTQEEIDDSSIKQVIENTLSEEEIKNIAKEENISEENVPNVVLNSVKEDFKQNGIIVKEGKTILQKIVAKIKQILLILFVTGTVFSSYAINNYNVNDIESFFERGMVKYGIITPEESKLEIKNKKINVLNTNDKNYENEITFFEKLNQNTDGIWSYKNQWLNKNGFVYIAGVNNKNYKSGKKQDILNVEGVAHHLIMSEANDLTDFTSNEDLKKASEQILLLGKDNEYVPVIIRLGDNKIKMQYKTYKEARQNISENSFTPIRLRQTTVDDLDFNKTIKAEGFNRNLKSITQKSTNRSFNSLVFTDKDSYGKFSGGAVVLLFKDKKNNLIVREYSGSINGIINEINIVKQQFQIEDKDITLGVYDAGSYTGKVGAKNGILSPKQWSGYNLNDYAGSSLSIPTQNKKESVNSTDLSSTTNNKNINTDDFVKNLYNKYKDTDTNETIEEFIIKLKCQL